MIMTPWVRPDDLVFDIAFPNEIALAILESRKGRCEQRDMKKKSYNPLPRGISNGRQVAI